ncbi:hypothetical protein HanRHA438_Chr00c17g0850941 [Helianthus annuus]|nr:hypothetical protein HanHA300_Chr11g0386601 [Helianthus annuus]KAJ0516006.1 hypothetical protein HanHA89_Chr11g0409031 [Helianthus annuus]KAJ0684015.1 hypothetical protein HanLR1_Chr11g0386571 [Helianthus annuus]KAJ0687972.1 hypothetical protein HanOQP8_Chr11g0389241 [Helianthus annuus]KAJ0954388.1 hypothetical protein HanRHA438_Chr00c17g0850941 [Helianthus annuus]
MTFQKFVTSTPKGAKPLGLPLFDRWLQGAPPRDTSIQLVAVIKKEKTHLFICDHNHSFKGHVYSRRDMSLHSYPLD